MDWSDRYALGVELIDSQHKTLFRLIDQLAKGIQEGNSEQVLMNILSQLSEYTLTHFDTENRLMIESGYPDAVEHGTRHAELVKSLNALVAQAQRGEPWVSLQTMNFLRQWLYHHIDDTDRHLGVYLKNRSGT